MGGGDQLGSAAILGLVLAVGLLLFFLLVVLVRAIWRWIFRGKKPADQGRQKHEPRLDLPRAGHGAGVSASDLFVIRSNLDAVSRQIEDLERRLRLDAVGKGPDPVAARD